VPHQEQVRFPTSGLEASSLSPDQLYIVGQAASILHVPPSVLLDVHRQQDPHSILERAASILQVPLSALRDLRLAHAHADKRQRLSSDVPMSPPFLGGDPSRDEEKRSAVGQAEQHGPGGRRQFPVMTETSTLLEWSGSGIAECFASFSVCQPTSGYESDPGKSSHRVVLCQLADADRRVQQCARLGCL